MRNRWMVLCCVLAVAAACGKDENNQNNSGSNSASNNASNAANNSNNASTSSNNANNTTSSNNTSNNPNNANGNPRTEPFITRFSYYVEDDSIGASDGYTVSVVSGDIANQDGNTRTMTVEDASNFEMTHMTADTVMKMRDGWNCPDVGTGDMGVSDMGDMGAGTSDDARHIFEARIQDGGITTEIQNITGCVQGQVPDVVTIIEAINALGESYL